MNWNQQNRSLPGGWSHVSGCGWKAYGSWIHLQAYVPAPGRRRRAGTRAYHARTAPAGHRTPGVGIGTERREQTSAHFTVHSMSSRASKKSRRGCMARAPIPIPPALPYRIPPTRGDGPLRHVPGGGLALSACGLRLTKLCRHSSARTVYAQRGTRAVLGATAGATVGEEGLWKPRPKLMVSAHARFRSRGETFAPWV
jgi:hypothetical protein